MVYTAGRRRPDRSWRPLLFGGSRESSDAVCFCEDMGVAWRMNVSETRDVWRSREKTMIVVVLEEKRRDLGVRSFSSVQLKVEGPILSTGRDRGLSVLCSASIDLHGTS